MNDVHVNLLALFCRNGGGRGCTSVKGDDTATEDEEEDEEEDDETFFWLSSCLFVVSVVASDVFGIPSDDGDDVE